MTTNSKVRTKLMPDWIDPALVFTTLYGDENSAFWLDSSLTNTNNRFSYMGLPAEIYTYKLNTNSITIQTAAETVSLRQDIFTFLENKLGIKHTSDLNLPFPFIGGLVGYFGYEVGTYRKTPPSYESPDPDALWFLVNNFIAFDHFEHKMYLVCLEDNSFDSSKWFGGVSHALTNPQNKPFRPQSAGAADDIKFSYARTKLQYMADIKAAQGYLRAGESYELCLTNSLGLTSHIDPLDLYLQLRRTSPAPFASYFKHDSLAIVSASPELFLKIDENRRIEAKPMKGTIARGHSPVEDGKLINQLRTSKKDWSENAIIVDLLRNDIGRVCKFGTVKVSKLMELETYATVHTLVSTIEGAMRDDVTAIDCIKSCFPGGSMTGAPKTRALEILENLECRARGIYSGSLGFLSFNQAMALNIVIRTIVIEADTLTIGAGGAIVLDSDPESEFDEMMLKTRGLITAIKKVHSE